MSVIFIITVATMLFLIMLLTYVPKQKADCDGNMFCDIDSTAWNGSKCVGKNKDGDKYCDKNTTKWNGSECIGLNEQ